MNQLPLFHSILPTKPVNVASIPKRSPFRYPGGKTWLVPFIRKWLYKYDSELIEFLEPFAGGAIIGLTVAFEKLARYVTLVELDSDVIAVWQTIFSDDVRWLANKILEFDLNDITVDIELSTPPNSIKERAFQTILKNRVNHGGILAPGAGRLKNGENGKGMLSRWYPQTLYKRILEIEKIRERITCVHGDGFEIIETYSKRKNNIFFIDPPYTAGKKNAGSRLYTHNQIDHENLFSLASQIQGDFLMTYDNVPEVIDLARKHGFDSQQVLMNNTHHAEITELLIGRDLEWARTDTLPFPVK